MVKLTIPTSVRVKAAEAARRDVAKLIDEGREAIRLGAPARQVHGVVIEAKRMVRRLGR